MVSPTFKKKIIALVYFLKTNKQTHKKPEIGKSFNAFQFSIFMVGVWQIVSRRSHQCANVDFCCPLIPRHCHLWTLFNMCNICMLAFPIQIKIWFTLFIGNLWLLILDFLRGRPSRYLRGVHTRLLFLFSLPDTFKYSLLFSEKRPPPIC